MPYLSSIASVLAGSKGFAFSTPLRSISDFEQPGYFSWMGQWFQVNRWESRLLIVTPSLVDAPRTPSTQQYRSSGNSQSSYGVLIRKDDGIYKYQAMEHSGLFSGCWHPIVVTSLGIDEFFALSVIQECKGPYVQ